MRTSRSIAPVIAGLACLAAMTVAGFAESESTRQFDSVELPPPLQRVLDDYEVAWAARDAPALAALFVEDGFVLSGGRPPIRGREAIEEHYTGKGGPLSLRALHFAAEGPIAYIIGGYAGREGQPDVGKFTLTLRREGDRWLIVSDMDSGNAPPRRRPD